MDLKLFLLTLRARFGVFVVVLCAAVLTAAVVSLLLPKTYKSTVSLLVDTKDEQTLSGTPQLLYYPQEKPSYLQTQTDIITSEKVARKVVKDLKLAADPELRDAFVKQTGGKGRIEDWLATSLLETLKVDTTQSSVINVTFSASDSGVAAQVANAFAKAYIDTTLELRVEPSRQAAAWLDEQVVSLRSKLEEAQTKLTNYQKENGIVATDERLDIENTRLGELSVQVTRAQEQMLDWKTREQQARNFLDGGASPERVPEVLSNPFIQSLKTELMRGEAKLQDLATQYGASYPLYQRQLSENRSLRERLDTEMGKVVAGIENSARQSRQRETELRAAMAAQRARVLESRQDRTGLAVLMRNVESAQRTYEMAVQRAAASSVESRARQTSVAVLNPAVEPRKPFRPRITLNIALAAVVGTMLGIGIVILMEMRDRRVRSRNDLIVEQDVPLLAVLNSWEPAGHRLIGWSGGMRTLPKPN
jgi:chain length determinant protein EpsF